MKPDFSGEYVLDRTASGRRSLTTMKYTTLSLTEIRTALGDIARDTQRTFGGLDEHQLNWRPDTKRWSIAQCFDHLVRGNRLLLEAADAALNHPAWSVWQRLPVLPSVFGQALIRSQSPRTIGRYTAPARARPAESQISDDILQRFVAQHREAVEWMRGFDQEVANRAIMISPFVQFVTYSVMDGLRLMVAHDRRHLEQAERVARSPTFARDRGQRAC